MCRRARAWTALRQPPTGRDIRNDEVATRTLDPTPRIQIMILFVSAALGAFDRVRRGRRVTRDGHDGYAYALAATAFDTLVQ